MRSINLKFKKIPKLALCFYFVGFLILIVAMILLRNPPQYLSSTTLQQLFIGGALIVTLGSVINTFYQFKSKEKNKE
ncbi:hypothetical protein [Aliikangiella maris]|uniref:Uncharacterized protein n=2 Tax=Aliikangiella maris TaxID=3162458 RepID=A0ABV3MP22_9GAMM